MIIKKPYGSYSASEDARKRPVSRDPEIVTGRILDAAEAEFMTSGYEAASTNRMVAAFGGSKATLFRYFPTKQALLEAVIRRITARGQARVSGVVGQEDDPSAWLTTFVTQVLSWILGEDALFLGRLGIAEGHKLPTLSGVFHATAGAPLQRQLAEQLERWTRDGRLACDDPAADAQRLFDLAIAGAVSRALYGAERLAGVALTDHAAASVALFLQGRAPR